MPRTVDDIEQDEAPRDKTTRNSLNTRARDNRKKETTDVDTLDDSTKNRSDKDGGHRRNQSGGTQTGGSGNQTRSGNTTVQSSNPDLAIADFVTNLFGSTSGGVTGGGTNTGGGTGGGTNTGGGTGGTNTGGGTGGTNTGGGTGGGREEQPPKDDNFIDNTPDNGEQNTGGDRSGQFGEGTGTNPPSFFGEGRNRSKGKYVEYKGVQYPIDRKGTEYSDTETDISKQNAAWQDDTFTVGTTTFNLKDYFNLSDEEKISKFNDALGLKNPQNPSEKIDVSSIRYVIKPESKYGMVVVVKPPSGVTAPNSNYDGDIAFEDDGNLIINGTKYSSKNVTINGGDTAAEWLSKLVDSRLKKPDGSSDDSPRNTYVGWGLGEPPASNTDTPNDENPATNPTDPEQKFEAKEKSNQSPEGAPVNVENSKALTTAKLRDLQESKAEVPVSMRITSHLINLTSAPPVKGPNWGFRAQKTENLGLKENELKVESKLTHSVKWYFGAVWSGLTKKPVLGVDIPSDKSLLKMIDYPIIMNFPEVGIPNNVVPYVAENQTEQHRMVKENAGFGPTGKYGIGTDLQYSNWAEIHHWCGMFAKHACEHSGYKPVRQFKWSVANGVTITYSANTPNPITKETNGTYGNVPMFINPETNNWEVDPEFYKMGSPSSGEGDQREFNKMYTFYKKTHFEKKTVTNNTVIVKGKPKNKESVKSEKIAIQVYESLLPNPISIYFINGVHYNGSGLTEMGKKLMEHFLSQRGWETSIITRGSHIELCGYLNPDGSMWRLGGNTKSGSVTGAGGQFASQKGFIWNFGDTKKPGQHCAFHKLTPTSEYQKIEPTMNGQFRRTDLVDSYYKALKGGDKKVLKTLKNNLYDQIVEPG